MDDIIQAKIVDLYMRKHHKFEKSHYKNEDGVLCFACKKGYKCLRHKKNMDYDSNKELEE